MEDVEYTFWEVQLYLRGGSTIEPQWALAIDNTFDLITFWIDTSPYEARRAIADFMNVKIKGYHFSNPTAYAINTIALNRGGSFVDALGDMLGEKLRGMIRMLNDGYTVLVWSNGSYACSTKGYKILQKIKKDKMIWPELMGQTKVNRWFDGKHYYAKVGLIDVVGDDGKTKWNTYSEAMRQAKKFIATVSKTE